MPRPWPIGKDKHDRSIFGWTVLAEDEKYRRMLEKFGGIRLEAMRPARERPMFAPDRLPHYSYRWPTSGDGIADEVIEDVTRYGKPALEFVRDRRDLARIYLATGTVRRGGVWVEMRIEGLGKRIPAVLVLARDMGDAEIEAEALAALERYGDRDISWIEGQPFLVSESMVLRARQLDPHTDVDLSDLYRRRGRRRA